MTVTELDAVKAANAIKLRRIELGLTQEGLAHLTTQLSHLDSDSTVSQRTISDVENGKINPGALSAKRLSTLIQALEWSLEEFESHTGIPLGGFKSPYADVQAPINIPTVNQLTPTADWGEGADNALTPTRVSLPQIEDARLENLVAYEIVGETLADDSSRGWLHIGARVVVDKSSTTPAPNDFLVVAFEDEGRKLKAVVQEGDTAKVLLRPFSGAHEDSYLVPRNKMKVLGIVITFEPLRRRQRLRR